jgi:hypothetical protein
MASKHSRISGRLAWLSALQKLVGDHCWELASHEHEALDFDRTNGGHCDWMLFNEASTINHQTDP